MSVKRDVSSRSKTPNGASSANLPVGDDFKSEYVVDVQRARILAAMVDACAARGPALVTVADIVERAGIARRTFYDIFDDRQDCLHATIEEGLRRVSERVLQAYGGGSHWQGGLRESLAALLEYLDVEPTMGHLLIVGSLEAGPRVRELRRQTLMRVVAVIDEGRAVSKADKQLSSLTAEGVVGGVLSVLHTRLLEERDGSLLELTNPLMSMIVLPYLGVTAASKELSRPAPSPRQASDPNIDAPLRNLGLRLTYRTVRALVSVADNPGSSNRKIGEAAGIADQGQMSKLLSRLERSGLVRNACLGPGTGEPNAWMLTDRGAAIHATVARAENHDL